MKFNAGILLCSGILIAYISSANAVPMFGTKATGSDLVPDSGFLEDGGPGSSSASVSFTTFSAEASFAPTSTYLPILKAKSEGEDATFDDDRTQANAEAYQAFTSSIAQTISLDINLTSTVTNASGGTSGVLSNVYVIGGADFSVNDGFCRPGEFTFDGVYLCGTQISERTPKGIRWSNLFNGGDAPSLTETLVFSVGAGESFGIFAELSAGSFKGTADAFNTLSMQFEDDTFIEVIETPSAAVPEPSVFALLGVGLAGMGFARGKL